VDIAQILTSAISSIIGVLIAGQVVAAQHRRADRNAASGQPVSVPASVRLTKDSRLGGVWRHGTVDIDGERVVWTPRTPWGRSVELAGVSYGSRHTPDGPLRWLLPPAAVVVSCSGGERSYELAILPGSVKFLFWAQVAA
jgi:hypothetical protein